MFAIATQKSRNLVLSRGFRWSRLFSLTSPTKRLNDGQTSSKNVRHMNCAAALSVPLQSLHSKASTGSNLNAAHGPDGKLVNLILPYDADQRRVQIQETHDMPSITLDPFSLCDIELLLNGSYSPLEGFMDKKTYNSVVTDMRLPDGTLWPIPITLDISQTTLDAIEASKSSKAILNDEHGNPIAMLTISDIWEPDKNVEGLAVFGIKSHPGVPRLHLRNPYYIGGRLEGIQLPLMYSYADLRHSPQQIRDIMQDRNPKNVLAFHTRNPVYPTHVDMLKTLLHTNPQMELLIHPVVGISPNANDVDHFTRVRCYEAAMDRFKPHTATLSLCNFAIRNAGPREAILHAIIRKNYGATHFIVGRQHAGAGADENRQPFYEPFEARDFVKQHEAEIGINIVDVDTRVYVPWKRRFVWRSDVSNGQAFHDVDILEMRERLHDGTEIPEWFCFPEVVNILRETYKPRHEQGLSIFFTGYSGSGKTTVATALEERLNAVSSPRRPVIMLDGDVVRQLISAGLGFSREDRALNIKRIGFIASMVVKAGGLAIAAPIAPYEAERDFSRGCSEQYGGFLLVHLSTPMETCQTRDPKGLYEKARKGLLSNLTGVDDPYEIPINPEIRIDTSGSSIKQSVDAIINYLVEHSYIRLVE